MLDFLSRFGRSPLTKEQREQLRASAPVNSAGYDPWGLNHETTERTLRYSRWLYEDYFRVETVGAENIPAGRVLLVPNHSGQLPIDGILIAMAMLLEANPPRIVRGMVERWFPTIPFIGTLFIRCGQVVGDPENCVELLRREQAIMVFPEGTRGSGKTWWHRYKLQSFGTGFLRIALQTRSPIVPVAVIGGEETYPAIHNAAFLARLMGVPYFPVTPFFPLLGPVGMLPLPVRIQIRFGSPLRFMGDWDAPDDEIAEMVATVRDAVQEQLDAGLADRPRLRSLTAIAGSP